MERDVQNSPPDRPPDGPPSWDEVPDDLDDDEAPVADWFLSGEDTAVPRPRDRRPKARAGRGRRGNILDAALTLFNEAGYGGASIQDIAAEARASVGSIYHHFGGKEEIAAALYVEGLRDYHRGLLGELGRGRESAEDAVKGLVAYHLGWVERNRELARFLLTSRTPEVVGATAHRLDEMNKRVFGQVQRWMDRWIEAGEIERLPISMLHAVVLGPSQEFCRHRAGGRTDESIDRAAPVLAEAAWKAVRA